MPLGVPRARLPLPRLMFIAAVSITAACSFLAPTDNELMGGHQPARPAPTSEATSAAGSAGRDTGAAGQGEAQGGSRPDQGGALNSATGESGMSGAAGEPAMSGAAGASSSTICDANHRDCNGRPDDGCETDLTLSAHCGGCGTEFECGLDTQCLGQRCVSISGCSDGTRDGFGPPTSFETIAGCGANWPLASMLSVKIGQPCGPSLMQNCQVPADACGAYWHVCGATTAGAAEVSDRLSVDDCNSKTRSGAFAIAVGDQSCACSAAGAGAACCGNNCVPQNGSCIYPKATAWYGVILSHINACGNIESLAATAYPHGVLCCRDAP